MKKKWINFFGCIAIGLAIFTSCNEENIDPIIDDGDPEVTGEAMFSALIGNLDGLPISPNVETKGVVGDEAKVTNIRVVLFDTRDNGEVLYSWDMGISTNGSTIDGPDVVAGGADNFTTTARLVAYRDYDMVVLVNPSETLMKETVAGKDKSILNNAQTYNNDLTQLIGKQLGSVTAATGLRFFMTNADSYVRVSKTQLQKTKALAEANPVILSVERAVAKVVVKNEASTTDTDYGTKYEIGTSVTWKLDITNKSTYLMRKPTLLYDGRSAEIPTTTIPAPNLLHRYAEDTNFTQGTSADFNNISVGDIPTTQLANANCWEYAMENTMKADKQYQDVTTRVVVKANYIPKIHTSSAISANDSYYTYRGYYIKESDMRGYAAPSSTIPDKYYGLRETIDEYSSQPGKSLTTEPSESFSFTSSVSDQPLTFYKGGISYYKILIRHFDDGLVSEKMAYGRFGVVRNNEYTITIDSFSGAGEIDIPDTKDPEDPDKPAPDEGDESWISAKVTIQPWVERTQNNGL